MASQTIHNSWRNSKQISLQNFMLIKIRYPNCRHGSDFLCFSLYELLMSLRNVFQPLGSGFPSPTCDEEVNK